MYGYNRNYGCRFLEFNLLGYRTVVIENEALRATVLADKGACLYELLHKPSDTDFLWRWERGLRPKDYVEPIPHPNGNFQEHFAGGWDEMFPSFGPPAQMGGLPVGYHGEVACVPWEYIVEQDDPEEVAIRFSVRTVRAPFRLDRTLSLRRRRPTLFVSEEVVNEAGVEVAFTWGHHPSFGPPFLGPDCVIDVGAKRVIAYSRDAYDRGRVAAEDQEGEWPYLKGRDGRPVDLSRVLGPETGLSDCFYVTEFDEPAWTAVTNRATGIGIGLSWSKSTMPHALLWQGFCGDEGAPWWGRAYTLCIEPLSSRPMDFTEAVRQGTALRLGPGQSIRFEMTATAYTGTKRVGAITSDGEILWTH